MTSEQSRGGKIYITSTSVINVPHVSAIPPDGVLALLELVVLGLLKLERGVRVLLLEDGLVLVADDLGRLVLLLGDDDLGGLVLHLQDGPAAGVGVLLLGDGVRGLPGPRRRLRIG